MKHGCHFILVLLVMGLFFSPAERREIEGYPMAGDTPERDDKHDTKPTPGYGVLRSPDGMLKRWGQRKAAPDEVEWRQER